MTAKKSKAKSKAKRGVVERFLAGESLAEISQYCSTFPGTICWCVEKPLREALRKRRKVDA